MGSGQHPSSTVARARGLRRPVWRVVAVWLAPAMLLGAPAAARAATTITLAGAPRPPQAVVLGAAGGIAYTVVASPAPIRVDVTLTDPTGKVVGQPAPNVGAVPISGQVPFPGAGQPAGRYTMTVSVVDEAIGPPEAVASTSFDAAASLGSLRLAQYEDVNGNGLRDPGEPGTPGREVDLTSPLGTTSSVFMGADGSADLAAVPTGTWQVAASAAPPWVPVGPASARVVVTPTLAGAFTAGSARPASIGGGVFDVTGGGRTAVAGAALTLAGTDGLGRPVSAQTSTGPGGEYLFSGLLPGTYVVTTQAPAGLAGAGPLASGGIVLPSGLGSLGHDFGLAAIPAPPPIALPSAAPSGGPVSPVARPPAPAGPPGGGVPKTLLELRRRAYRLWPTAGARLTTSRPLLRWARGPRRTVAYNVQIWQYPGLRRVLSAYPSGRVLKVGAGVLRPGRRYVWRAWPYMRGARYAPAPVGVSFFQIVARPGG
jgi:hypothetical protein